MCCSDGQEVNAVRKEHHRASEAEGSNTGTRQALKEKGEAAESCQRAEACHDRSGGLTRMTPSPRTNR